MTILTKLSVAFLVGASAFGLMALAQHKCTLTHFVGLAAAQTISAYDSQLLQPAVKVVGDFGDDFVARLGGIRLASQTTSSRQGIGPAIPTTPAPSAPARRFAPHLAQTPNLIEYRLRARLPNGLISIGSVSLVQMTLQKDRPSLAMRS